MISRADFFFSQLSCAALMLTLIGLWLTAVMPGLDSWNRRFFFVLFSTLALVSLSGDIIVVLDLNFWPVTADSILLYYWMTLLESAVLPMLAIYLLHCSGDRIKGNHLFRTEIALWAAFFILLQFTLFTDCFYWQTPDNQLARGPWFPLMMLPLNISMLLNLASLFRRRGRLTKKIFIGFLIAFLPLTFSLIILIFVEVFWLVDSCLAISMLMMFSFVLTEQLGQNIRQQQEIANQRASIMVLQMRPHFIYNTMMSIYGLCKQDPMKARQVIMDFTAYLRKNFTAIASNAPIPFTSELEHTRAYLAVEQAQYEDSLFVEYDTPHVWFRVPPLTLQPIVENAVKHGRDPYAGAFFVSIRTRKTDSGSEIVVSDNGRGFDGAEDSEGHLALNNIRHRLEIMCGGSLTIAPNDGGGTVVTLTIPDHAAQ